MFLSRVRLPLGILFSLLLAITLISFCAGLYFGAVKLDFFNLAVQHKIIFYELRLPRVLLALILGSILAVCGCISQSLFRNALADPSLIGVTAGASLGASIMIVGLMQFGHQFFGIPLIAGGAFLGGLAAVVLVYQLAEKLNQGSVLTMLLVGIAVTAFVSAITGLLDFYANDEQLKRMSLWRMGGLQGADYSSVLIAGLVLFGICLSSSIHKYKLDALLLGESEARHLGVKVKSIKLHLIMLIALGTGTAVALAGTIAFVGLIVPHILRLLVGPGHRILLPASAFGGAILLSLADTLSRTLFAPTELPIGLLTALIGAPFFVVLLRQAHVK